MSNNGEDIIRETFEKLSDVIGVQMQIPDAMIANLGAVLQAQIDLLAELQSAGRLIPDGGMALTAEQVEDVRTAREELRGYRNFTGYGRSYVNRLIAAVDALFPATEPAAEAPNLAAVAQEPRRFDPADECQNDNHDPGCVCGAQHWMTASAPAEPAEEPCTGNLWCEAPLHAEGCYATHRIPPGRLAPAEPAEEETKAERDSQGIIRINGGRIVALSRDPRELVQQWYDLAEPGSKWQRDYAAALDLFDREAASSPVVPAPTETGPWQDISEAPKHLTLIDRVGDKWTYDGDNWVTPETAILPVLYINRKYAPFVAAAEGS